MGKFGEKKRIAFKSPLSDMLSEMKSIHFNLS